MRRILVNKHRMCDEFIEMVKFVQMMWWPPELDCVWWGTVSQSVTRTRYSLLITYFFPHLPEQLFNSRHTSVSLLPLQKCNISSICDWVSETQISTSVKERVSSTSKTRQSNKSVKLFVLSRIPNLKTIKLYWGCNVYLHEPSLWSQLHLVEVSRTRNLSGKLCFINSSHFESRKHGFVSVDSDW
jgi:hypothetical protein